jgi:hypothetical protein
MIDPVRHLTEAGHLGSFFVDGGWRKPEGTLRKLPTDGSIQAVPQSA